jgi:hypothetical protein
MNTGYTTVFEVSYFSNGTFFFSAVTLFVGLFAGGVASVIYGRLPVGEAKTIQERFFYFRLIVLVWIAISTFWFCSNIFQAHKLIHTLRSGGCESVEGTVHVLNREPWGGHGADSVRIADKTFGYSSHAATLGYHGGELLMEGVTARIHFLGNTILKVEIKQ